MGKLLPIPDISNKRFTEAAEFEAQGLHTKLFRFSPSDYTQLGQVWNGPHPEDGQELEVTDGIPQGATPPDLDEEPQLTSPAGPDAEQIDPEMLMDYANRIFGKGRMNLDEEVPPVAKRSSRRK